MKSREQKPLYTLFFDGKEVEVLAFRIIFGRTYADIRMQDGTTKTVPAEKLSNKETKNESQY